MEHSNHKGQEMKSIFHGTMMDISKMKKMMKEMKEHMKGMQEMMSSMEEMMSKM